MYDEYHILEREKLMKKLQQSLTGVEVVANLGNNGPNFL